ncbi:hypothetical protein B0H16DRAFT_1729606 [Mycena metata]|uniref:Uncharacterized protein n=1 Tax=Mycena metata TaxID=1033252 RepID=A0AAD7IAR8_9AGAR|nr:hypothetical protein B0H16DRAFT_1729606 [Mycena metata]
MPAPTAYRLGVTESDHPHHGGAQNVAQSPVGYHKARKASATADASGALPNLRALSSPNSRRVSAGLSTDNNPAFFSATNPGPTPHAFELNKPDHPNTSRREGKRHERTSGSRASPTPGALPNHGDSDDSSEDDPLEYKPADEDQIMTDLSNGQNQPGDNRNTAAGDNNGGERRRPFNERAAGSNAGADTDGEGGAGSGPNTGGAGGTLPPPVIIPRIILPLPYSRPTEAGFLAVPPKTRGSPHKKNPAYDLPLAGPDDMPVRVSFQPTQGNLDRPVLDGHLLVANVAEKYIATLNKNPDEFGIIAPFLGGSELYAAYGPANLVTAITHRWRSCLNIRLALDCQMTNKSRYTNKAMPKSLILKTWGEVIQDKDTLPADLTGELQVLVGIG